MAVYDISLIEIQNQQLVEIVVKGSVQLETAVEILQAVRSDDSFDNSLNRIWVLEDAFIDLGVEDIEKLIELMKADKQEDDANRKVAFVNSDETERAMLDLLAALSSHLNRRIKVFTNIDLARRWLVF